MKGFAETVELQEKGCRVGIRWLNALGQPIAGEHPGTLIFVSKRPSLSRKGLESISPQLELVDHIGREHDFVHLGACPDDRASKGSRSIGGVIPADFNSADDIGP